MNELLRANVRQHGRRYVATGVAVAISMAFVLLCLMFTQGLADTLSASIRDSYTGVAVVVDEDPAASDSPDMDALATELRGTPGVASVAERTSGWTELRSSSARLQRQVAVLLDQPFQQPDIVTGTEPDSAQGILLDQSAADQLGVSVGGQVDAVVTTGTGDGTVTTTTVPVTVTGISATDRFGTPTVGVTPEGMRAVSSAVQVDSLLVAAETSDPGATTQEELANTITRTLGTDPGVRVRTAGAALDNDLAGAKLGEGTMTAMLLTFPLIALLVASIVVSSTFQVVLQQRRRELALLRTVGATARQVRRLLLTETLVVGAVSSLVGVVAALLLGSWGLSVTGMSDSFVRALAGVRPVTVVGVWVLGTVLTTVLGMRPALAAASVPPMVALQPEDEAGAGARRVGRLRAVIGALLTLAGGGLVWAGLHMEDTSRGFLVVLGACMLCLVGLLLLCTLLLPALTHALGGVGRGPVAGMARENTLRNRRRTAATGTAIVIGVTLITTLLVGTGSLRTSVFDRLDAFAPIDVVASTTTGTLDEDLVGRIAGVEGVEATAVERSATGSIDADDGQGTETVSVLGEPDLSGVAHSAIEAPGADQVFLPTDRTQDGSRVSVCVGTGNCRTLSAVGSERVQWGQAVVASSVLSDLAPGAAVTAVDIRLSEDADVDGVQSAILSLDNSLDVSGAAPLRAQFTQMINTMLVVLLALLGVSVLVALVGVTNTLSLSVAERTRENGLLRALGLTRRQMKRMLLDEALMISGAGAAVGMVLGVAFGLIGTEAVTAASGIPAVHTLPWWQLALVVVVMVAAAVVASWWPGRRAARTSPVEALAAE